MTEQSTDRPAVPGDTEAERAESMGLHPRTETGPVHETGSPPPGNSDAEPVPTTTAVSEPLIDEALNDPTLPRVPGTSAAPASKP
jgi:hypothetical protein